MEIEAIRTHGAILSTAVKKTDLPGQILGPPLNGKKLNPGNNPSHRSGLNSAASEPQRSVRRCIEYRIQTIIWPFCTNTGFCPSTPPPRGRSVSLFANLASIGTTGKRRRVSFRTNRKYLSSLICSKVGGLPERKANSARSLAQMSGRRERMKRVEDMSEAVVSRPAIRVLITWSRSSCSLAVCLASS